MAPDLFFFALSLKTTKHDFIFAFQAIPKSILLLKSVLFSTCSLKFARFCCWILLKLSEKFLTHCGEISKTASPNFHSYYSLIKMTYGFCRQITFNFSVQRFLTADPANTGISNLWKDRKSHKVLATVGIQCDQWADFSVFARLYFSLCRLSLKCSKPNHPRLSPRTKSVSRISKC